ncbi:ORF6N domain-containing protein [Laribacter hongkongensis]|uniref:ORF6N domain-containing protein n=2 Tax=Laribacter hongkongensis TaxID=168471 RepID=UPI001EFCA244|nr:ORF6N domain-containing protein [Laribacter hongkongensis]MCG8992730.1 ORF6N domain-containing protein [Laribacter hongkongensis]MCG8998210.1 ORF6N domain-containing protein [Laribacter hongkongensis]MCG9002782.1 ORF6N domain-containing protein [Laribacter hongkongensis]MCG9002872.1 ORF6N domain-containing protein [Laribacter hongkongensis]MCG9006466.1 ORF6N domain-containing protein [Laribacter hongkongensis]
MLITAIVTKTTAAPLLKDAPIIDFGSIKLPQVTYKGQPVLTIRAVADALGCSSKNITDNFANNRAEFDQGADCFHLSANEARSMGFPYVAKTGRPRLLTSETIVSVLKDHEGNVSATARTLGVSRQTVMRARDGVSAVDPKISGPFLFSYSSAGIVLYTRRGLAKLSKSVGTPEAWAMMDTFIDAYFTLEGFATGSLFREEAAQKAHEVVAKGTSLLPGIDLQLAGKNAPKAFESPLHEAESLLKAALVSMGRAIGSNNMLQQQKEKLRA